MTKREVLQGALALNGSDKKYSVTVEDNKIVIEAKLIALFARKGIFRCVAHLNDDNTYVETHLVHGEGHTKFGKVVKVQKTISFTFGGNDIAVEVEKESFNSEDVKKVLRDYLESCGYQRTNKGFFKRLFGK